MFVLTGSIHGGATLDLLVKDCKHVTGEAAKIDSLTFAIFVPIFFLLL